MYDNKDDKDVVTRPFDYPAIKLIDRNEYLIQIYCTRIYRVNI